MPFTSEQLTVIAAMIDALDVEVNSICAVRDQIRGLTDDLHEGFASNDELMTVVGAAKARAKGSTDALSTLLE